MAASFERVAGALMWHDPRNVQWRPRATTPLAARVEQRLERLRTIASLSMSGRSALDQSARLRDIAATRELGTLQEIEIDPQRRPLVLAHGPSLAALLPAIKAHRDSLWLVVPFRTAVHLATLDIWADVVVLADRGTAPYRISETLWSELPVAVTGRLGRTATMVTDPFAPPSVYERFHRTIVLDDGTGALGASMAIPFWGAALLACLALPLALGATCAAAGGIDLKAAAGRARRTWSGAPARLDPEFSTLLGLLEVLATADRALVDVSAQSIAKRGFSHEPLDQYVRRTFGWVARGTAPPAPPRTWIEEAHARLMADAAAEEAFVASLREHAERGLRLTEQPDTSATRRAIAALVDAFERRWPEDPRFRHVIALMQPTYIIALTRLHKLGVRPVNPDEAARRKARLFCREIVDLADEYTVRLEEMRRPA